MTSLAKGELNRRVNQKKGRNLYCVKQGKEGNTFLGLKKSALIGEPRTLRYVRGQRKTSKEDGGITFFQRVEG